jgi:hypothetical protein
MLGGGTGGCGLGGTAFGGLIGCADGRSDFRCTWIRLSFICMLSSFSVCLIFSPFKSLFLAFRCH